VKATPDEIRKRFEHLADYLSDVDRGQRAIVDAPVALATLQGDVRELPLPAAAFDIILAGAVLHHLREEVEWRSVLDKLYKALRPGGALWISDLVSHDSEAIEELMRVRYGDYLISLGGEEARDRVFKEIAEQDTPRSLVFQVRLLREVGFDSVEILHKNTCFATFGALKLAPGV
jgi:tRNA (cmo5U34)-methyltransferase